MTNSVPIARAQSQILAPSTSFSARTTADLAPGTFFVSAERNGLWEIYAILPDGKWGQITRDFSPARAPALSPDGRQLAFQSHKDGNWEIYTLRLDSGQVTRLTNQPAYDGAPSWSPDGRQIAFESYRAGDLGIWVMNADGSNPTNLTSGDPTYDYSPSWSPRGDWIAYTSWATGHKQIFITSADGKQHINISQNRFEDEQPAWSTDGKRVAFVSNREGCEQVTDTIALNACQRREIFVADFDGARLSNAQQLTFEGRSSAPAWSPDGNYLAYVSPRTDHQPFFVIPAGGGIPRAVKAGPLQWIASAAWGVATPALSDAPPPSPPLYVEKAVSAPADVGHPFAFQELPQLYLAPSWGEMSSRVVNSLLTLRDRVKQESGYDFLGVLSDMTRQLNYKCGLSCDNLSWHKAGRAVDTRLDYTSRNGGSLLAIVREDELGETYWRLYLRAAAQDGTLGEPLKDAPWDFSYSSRAVIAPQQGGIEAALPSGYYVDFTELAREYGWMRISAHDDPGFDWRSNILATEYWHYQKTDGLNWYDALSELYPSSDLRSILDWNRIVRIWGVDGMRLFFKGIPPPPDVWKWFALLPREQP